MELNNDFEVRLPVEEAWEVLTDLERIAPCMPGAELKEVDGDEYKGVVKVKVGPITALYRGAARFAQKQDATHKAVLAAEGRDTRGQGNARATITAVLEPAGDATRVSLTTDLQITGKVAQFGRGVLADVSSKLLGQFVENLERTVHDAARHEEEEAPSESTPATESEVARAEAAGAGTTRAEVTRPETARPEPAAVEPVDLFAVAGPALARRLLPALGAAVAFLAVVALVRRLLRD